MSDYLASLRRMRSLSGLRYLCGSHGAAVYDAVGKIDEYIAHRLEREKQIIEAIEGGAKNAVEIAEKVYAGIDPRIFDLAVESVRAHLAKIQCDGLLRNSAVEF
jgi:glyoxylase-like metal-dependent hydrolase (beta-lactamase superfamily II)